MQNFKVTDTPGYDTHGLPIEVQMEKILKIKNKQEILNFGTDKFIKKCKEFAQKNGYDLPFVYDNKSRSEKNLGFNGAGLLIIIDTKYNIRMLHTGYNQSEDFIGSISRHIEHYLAEN